MAVFRGNKSFYDFEISDQVGQNIKSWLDYALVEACAYTNVTPTSASGYMALKRMDSDEYPAGCVFEGLGPSWIWESGVVPISGSTAPVVASGIYINNVFYLSPVTSGINQHFIDYANGRVIFNTAQTGSIKCQYSFRDIKVYLNDEPQWKTLITNYQSQFDNVLPTNPSGLSSILKEDRVWLPAVVIETRDSSSTGMQLGGGEIASCNIYYHIFSDKPFSNKRLADFINNQKEVKLMLYDVNTAPLSLNYDGSLGSGALTYKQLASLNSPYFWATSYIEDSNGGQRDVVGNLYRAEVRQKLNVARYLNTY